MEQPLGPSSVVRAWLLIRFASEHRMTQVTKVVGDPIPPPTELLLIRMDAGDVSAEHRFHPTTFGFPDVQMCSAGQQSGD